MSTAIRWETGGEASLLSLRGDAATLVSTVPSPPGSRLLGRADIVSKLTIRIKVHSCRRQGDGAFVIQARLIDLTREERAMLKPLQGTDAGTEPAKRE